MSKSAFNVARVINLKLFFADYFFHNLVIFFVIMQNPIAKLRQISIISEKPGFLSEKLKTLTSFNCHRV